MTTWEISVKLIYFSYVTQMNDIHSIYDEDGVDYINDASDDEYTVENYTKFDSDTIHKNDSSDDDNERHSESDHKCGGNADKSDEHSHDTMLSYDNMLSYDPYEFVSKCCRAFLFYDRLSIYCSKCGKEIDKIEPGQAVKISVKFNSTTDETSISGDVLRAFQNSLPRFATDPTCELCERKCKKCSTKMRYLRDRKGDLWYVCSNKDCRSVDSPNDTIVSD